MSTPSAASAPAAPPVFGRAAIAILGSMIGLIVALTVLLIETTWSNPASASQTPAIEQGSPAQR